MDDTAKQRLARLHGVRTDPGNYGAPPGPSPKPRKGLFRTISDSMHFFSKKAKSTEPTPSRTLNDDSRGSLKPKKQAKSSVANWRMTLADTRVQTDIETKNRQQREEQTQKIMLLLQQKEEESRESDSEVEDLENILRRADSLMLRPQADLQGSVCSLVSRDTATPSSTSSLHSDTPAESASQPKTPEGQPPSPSVAAGKPDSNEQLVAVLAHLDGSINNLADQTRPRNTRFRTIASMPILLKRMKDTSNEKDLKSEPTALEQLDPIRYFQSLPPASECSNRVPHNVGTDVGGESNSSEWESEGEVMVDGCHLGRRATVAGPAVRRVTRPALLARKRSQAVTRAD